MDAQKELAKLDPKSKLLLFVLLSVKLGQALGLTYDEVQSAFTFASTIMPEVDKEDPAPETVLKGEQLLEMLTQGAVN